MDAFTDFDTIFASNPSTTVNLSNVDSTFASSEARPQTAADGTEELDSLHDAERPGASGAYAWCVIA